MQSAIAAAAARAYSTPGILLMEGDTLMRGLLSEWLTSAGYAVLEGPSRPGAATHDADVVIVDLYMPREAGARIIRAVQRSHPGVPVIAISGQFRAGLTATSPVARMLGAARILAKPFSREDLLAAVRALVGPPR
jgi:DNA-binding response OmpR family regulator